MLRRFVILTLGVALGGCAPDLRGTEGENKLVRFAYATPGACDGCPLEAPVLVGSVLDIELYGLNVRNVYGVRSTAPEIADFHWTARCRAAEEDCRDLVVVTTKAPGDATLEVYDEWTGTVTDRVAVHVREASSLETTVLASEPSGASEVVPSSVDGSIELRVDSDVEIVSRAMGPDGTQLIATSAALQSAYADERVIGPRQVLIDAAPREYAKAKRPGTASVVIAGAGARQELLFRVVR